MLCERHHVSMRVVNGRLVCTACLAALSLPAIERVATSRRHEHDDQRARDVRACGIPERFALADFSNFEPPNPSAGKVARALQGYAEHFDTQRELRTGFLFVGAPGTGKTHLAASVARRVLAHGLDVRYCSVPGLTLQVRRTYKERECESVADIVAGLVAPDLLVLDEIDLHGSSDADYQVLYEIVNGRYERGCAPTIAISNRPVTDLNADLNERITSRIMGGFPAVVFDWPGRRPAGVVKTKVEKA